jgi:superfamily II DNA or RNA helicase
MLCAKLAVKTLVVVPTIGLKLQLSKTLAWLPFVRVENIDSTELPKLTGFDCLIIDECHHAAAKTYQNLNKVAWRGIYYRFFFTATYFRNQDNENLLFEGVCGKAVYELPIKTAIKRNIISKIDAFYIDLPKQETDAYTWGQVYSELVVNNTSRNNIVAALLQRLHAVEAPTLCLVKEVAHGAILSDLTGIPFVHGQDESTRPYIQQFNEGKIKALIGTAQILGEGVDTVPAEYVVIPCLGKAKSSFMQWVGRVMRRAKGKESGKVIIFRDPSHKFCLRHFAVQRRILKEEYGVTTIKLEGP